MENLLAGAYLAKGTIGDVGTPGAPIATFSLVVVPSQNSVTGTVEISQAVNGSDNHIAVQVKGKIHASGFGQYTKMISLAGQYVQYFPTPAIGSFLADFDANFAIDNAWSGTGGFSYYQNQIENVPVETANSLKEELV